MPKKVDEIATEAQALDVEVGLGATMNTPQRVYRCYARMFNLFMALQKEADKPKPDPVRVGSLASEITRRQQALKAIKLPFPRNLKEAAHTANAYLEGHPRQLGGGGR